MRSIATATLNKKSSMTNTKALATRNGTFRVAIHGASGAPVLLLSNSLGTTLEMWSEQVPVFSSTHQVVCYDTRGHGGSPISQGPYDFNSLGDDVLAIMDALNVERAVFCGISMGGHTGLWLGAHAGERFDGIAVCNSAAKIGTAHAWDERAASVRLGGKDAMKQLAASAPERWFSQEYIAANPEAVSTAQGWLEHIDPEGYAACCEALADSDLRAELGRIVVPTLLLAGESDPVTTVADAHSMHKAIAGSRLATVPASHLSSLEAPQAFNRALSGFIATL